MPRKKAVDPVLYVPKAPAKKQAAQKKLPPQIVSQNGTPLTAEAVAKIVADALAGQNKMEAVDQAQYVQSAEPSVKAKRDASFGPGEQVKAASPVGEAISNLTSALNDAHQYIEYLVSQLEPHLPRHLYDLKDCGDAGCAPSRVPDYSENASSTVNSINSATNELDRLSRRINFLRDNLIV